MRLSRNSVERGYANERFFLIHKTRVNLSVNSLFLYMKFLYLKIHNTYIHILTLERICNKNFKCVYTNAFKILVQEKNKYTVKRGQVKNKTVKPSIILAKRQKQKKTNEDSYTFCGATSRQIICQNANSKSMCLKWSNLKQGVTACSYVNNQTTNHGTNKLKVIEYRSYLRQTIL